jgi:hypothetical protein
MWHAMFVEQNPVTAKILRTARRGTLRQCRRS